MLSTWNQQRQYSVSISLCPAQKVGEIEVQCIYFFLNPLNSDLVLAPSILTFLPGGSLSSECTVVTINSTDGLEDIEIVNLTLASLHLARILIGLPAITSIHIENTDGDS